MLNARSNCTIVKRGRNWWYAECKMCRWEGNFRRFEEEAEEEAHSHDELHT